MAAKTPNKDKLFNNRCLPCNNFVDCEDANKDKLIHNGCLCCSKFSVGSEDAKLKTNYLTTDVRSMWKTNYLTTDVCPVVILLMVKMPMEDNNLKTGVHTIINLWQWRHQNS